MTIQEVAPMTSQPSADRSPAGGYPPTMPQGQTGDAFHLYREVDRLERSVAENARRIDTLDTHGSRGVDGLKQQVEQIRKDLMDHETLHTEAAKQATASRRWMIGLL